MGSAGHRANILNATFTQSGMGVAVSGSGVYYFTQLFMRTTKGESEVYVLEHVSGPGWEIK